MGLVSQESILFNDSISNNIKLSNSKVNLKENEAPLQLNNSACVPGLSFNLISVGIEFN